MDLGFIHYIIGFGPPPPLGYVTVWSARSHSATVTRVMILILSSSLFTSFSRPSSSLRQHSFFVLNTNWIFSVQSPRPDFSLGSANQRISHGRTVSWNHLPAPSSVSYSATSNSRIFYRQNTETWNLSTIWALRKPQSTYQSNRKSNTLVKRAI